MSIEQPSIEQNEILLGKWELRVDFKLRNGEDYKIDFDNPISLFKGMTEDDLRRMAISHASSLGLHNFGMDTYTERYPDGQPVKFTLKHESGKEIEFSQNFNGSGYPIYEK